MTTAVQTAVVGLTLGLIGTGRLDDGWWHDKEDDTWWLCLDVDGQAHWWQNWNGWWNLGHGLWWSEREHRIWAEVALGYCYKRRSHPPYYERAFFSPGWVPIDMIPFMDYLLLSA